ncbi:MAG: sugar phosphate nucleotidyltransferase [Terrimicrobiaceae bacterium]|nr:sugar phosphate nucleotidyltransferase [Terrimicrobiaceae bacterium]
MATVAFLGDGSRAMTVTKALITAAGPGQRTLPLQTLVDRGGVPRSVLAFLLDEAASAGIERGGGGICPGDAALYERAAGEARVAVTFIEQPEPLGYADAVLRGAEFLAGDAFLLMVSDHLYISRDPGKSCARQLVEVAAAEQCAVSAVQATHESQLSSFGTVGGRLFEGRKGLYEAERVVEKPTPTFAEQELAVPGLRQGYYLCLFGMHVLTAHILRRLEALRAAAADPRTVTLCDALGSESSGVRHLAAELSGTRHDLDAPHGLLFTQLALALDSPQRAEVLAGLVEMLAGVRS